MTERIDYDKVFAALPSIMGVKLTNKYGKWQGPYRISLEGHDRPDKLCCFRNKSTVVVHESGGDSLTIWDWLLKYGECSSNKDVADRLLRKTENVVPIKPPVEKPSRFVNPTFLRRELEMVGKIEDNLFTSLCQLFPREKVIHVLREYNVTPNRMESGRVATTFWYVSNNGMVCHDNSIVYGKDMHRIKNGGTFRRFKVGNGYRNRCLFGDHIKTGKETWIVESEKTAILCRLMYGTRVLATGGGSKLKNPPEGSKLLPDYDDEGLKWVEKFPEQCVRWWEKFSNVKKGEDMGDVIVKLRRCVL